MNLLPEQLARIKIDKQLNEAGWDIVSREEYIPNHAQAVKEALMSGTTESDYLLFIDNKAIAVVEAKRYYEEILGLKKKFDFSDKGMVAYNIGNEEPEIILKDKNKFENLKPTIWFEVEDVAIFYKEMLNNGIKFLSEPFKIGTGNAVEFEDPFGNRLGVTDYIK